LPVTNGICWRCVRHFTWGHYSGPSWLFLILPDTPDLCSILTLMRNHRCFACAYSRKAILQITRTIFRETAPDAPEGRMAVALV
jgi:hypothetical protein